VVFLRINRELSAGDGEQAVGRAHLTITQTLKLLIQIKPEFNIDELKLSRINVDEPMWFQIKRME
jgi:hypothetical protein